MSVGWCVGLLVALQCLAEHLPVFVGVVRQIGGGFAGFWFRAAIDFWGRLQAPVGRCEQGNMLKILGH